MKGNREIGEFAKWVREQSHRLRTLELREAVDEISGELVKVDSGLGLEAADVGEFRELILTAEGDPNRFELVRSICSALGDIPSFAFTALKPARGFDFELTTREGGRLQASELFFEPLEADESPPRLGIRVFVPPELVKHEDIEWMLRLTAETGAGEERAAQIAFLEAAPTSDTPDDALPIEALGDFILHFLKVNRQ